MTSGPLSLVKIEAGSTEENLLANDALSLLSALSGGSGGTGGASPSPRSVGGGGNSSPRLASGASPPRSVGGGGASPRLSSSNSAGSLTSLGRVDSRAPAPEHERVSSSNEPGPREATGFREVRHVTAAGPPIAPGPRKGRPLPSTPPAPPYKLEGLLWNRTRTRNIENRYSYSGTWKKHTAALRCGRCQQFFFVDELGEGLLPEGFLPHQRNYRFNCAWCEPTGAEIFEVTKPKKFEAIVDGFLNMMATSRPRRVRSRAICRCL